MEFTEGKLKGSCIITLSPNKDERGFFMRTFDSAIFQKGGLAREWVQENHSRSEQQGIIRGLHFQLPPYSETKLVRCVRGSVLDVFVDLRSGSPTFGHWDSLVLSEQNMRMIFIPRGFAHGFCTLEPVSEVLYKVDNYYNKQAECGLIWNDPILGIEWPAKEPVLSVKDRKNMRLEEFIEKYQGI
jgi:dTDP-4-dehydrorhamnose 3,5-epimerase